MTLSTLSCRQVLRLVGVTVVDELPDYVKSHPLVLRLYVFSPTYLGVLQALQRRCCRHGTDAIAALIAEHASVDQKRALRQLLGTRASCVAAATYRVTLRILTGARQLYDVLRYACPKKIAPFSLGNFTVYCDMPFPRKLLLSPGNFTVYCDLPVPRKLPLSHWETLQCIAICLSQENCFFPLNFHRPGALPDAQQTASEH